MLSNNQQNIHNTYKEKNQIPSSLYRSAMLSLTTHVHFYSLHSSDKLCCAPSCQIYLDAILHIGMEFLSNK